MGRITVSGRGRRRLFGGHPWIYADDVHEGEGEAGELVPVSGPNAEPLGWGLFSTSSKIRVRMVTRLPEQPRRAFWEQRVRGAIEHRAKLGLNQPRAASRLIAGDADGLPGLIVDRYADCLVLQSGCQGSDRMRDFLLELVLESLDVPIEHVLDRSDSSVRRLESLESRVEWLRGGVEGALRVEEPGPLVYDVFPLEGHKTGHYLDQRENRRLAAEHAQGKRVLDAFSYDGLFGIRCALAGASEVLCLDQSATLGERVMHNAELNGVGEKVRFERTNAMHDLRARDQAGERFGVVICDPPAFARNKRELEGAERGYRELNRRAFGLLDPGGVLVTASCSYAMRRDHFRALVGEAARDAERWGRMFRETQAAPDHPVALAVPESDYLKCLFVRG